MSSLGGTSSTYWFCTIDSTSVKSRSCSYVAPLSVPLLATEPPSERVSTTSKEPITNAFCMESPRSRVASAPLSEPLFRVLRLALVTHLEIEARPLQRARVPHCPDALSLLHVVAFLHDDVGDVRVQRVVLVVVVQDDQVSVPLEPARVHDVSGEHGRHVAALPGLDVHAVAERPRSEPGMHLSAERAHHTALRRPRPPAPPHPLLTTRQAAPPPGRGPCPWPAAAGRGPPAARSAGSRATGSRHGTTSRRPPRA